jgi:60 kDa SS-A/Ro ribonucleoprotein
MPMTALVRNLAAMTRVGVVAPGSDGTKRAVAQLGDAERIRAARVHPIALLAALCTYAAGHGRRVDAVVYTDSETWAGDIHPVQALAEYRRASGIDARLIVVGLVSNGFSIADPNDPGMLDVVGFDTTTPQLVSDFARGAL